MNFLEYPFQSLLPFSLSLDACAMKPKKAPFKSTLSSTLDRILGTPSSSSVPLKESTNQALTAAPFQPVHTSEEKEPRIRATDPVTTIGLALKKKKVLRTLLSHESTHGASSAPSSPPRTAAGSPKRRPEDLKHIQDLLNSPPVQRTKKSLCQTPSQKDSAPLQQARNFVCQIEGCRKRFRRHDHLLRHSQLHSGCRPFRCELCDVSFNREDVYLLHEKTQKHLEKLLLDKMKKRVLSIPDIVEMMTRMN